MPLQPTISSPPFALSRRRLLLCLLGMPLAAHAKQGASLDFRLSPEDWGVAGPTELHKVLKSAAEPLWSQFPDRQPPRFVVLRGHQGPIVHFKKNIASELVMQLDAEDRHWAQFAYQFAHEFCHILANFEEDWPGNLWFEETLCETASLYTLRTMARTWRVNPPYPNWAAYAGELEKYAADVIKTRQPIASEELKSYYAKHTAKLSASPTNRVLNGSMAAALLPLFEAVPSRWESISWLNSSPSQPGETFSAYLTKWEQAVPSRHTGFVRLVKKLFLGTSE